MPRQAILRARLTLNSDQYRKTLKDSSKEAEAFKAIASTTGKIVVAAFAAAAAAIGAASIALAIGVKNAYELGRQMEIMSAKTGIAVDQLMILQQAGKENGIEDISTAIKKMQVNLADAVKNGAGPAAKAFNALGLDAEEMLKKAPIEQFQAIGDAINSIKDPTMKTAEAVAIFGRSGTDLLALFAKQGALGDAATHVGKQAQILKENAARFSAVAVGLENVGLKLQGFAVGVAEKLLPVMEIIANVINSTDLAAAGEAFGKKLRDAADYLVGAIANPQLTVNAFGGYLKYAMLEALNLFINGMLNSAIRFGAQLVEVIADALKLFSVGIQYAMVQAKNTSPWAKKDNRTFDQMMRDDPGNATMLEKAAELRKSAAAPGIDFTGSGKALAAANQAASLIKAVGKILIDAMEELNRRAEKVNEEDKYLSHALTNNGGLQLSSMEYGYGHMLASLSTVHDRFGRVGSTSALNRPAYDETPLLKAAERRRFENNLVAQGLQPGDNFRASRHHAGAGSKAGEGAYTGAYHVVRSGDRSRARNAAIEKERQNQKNQAANIAQMAAGIDAIKTGMGFTGGSSAGGGS